MKHLYQALELISGGLMVLFIGLAIYIFVVSTYESVHDPVSVMDAVQKAQR